MDKDYLQALGVSNSPRCRCSCMLGSDLCCTRKPQAPVQLDITTWLRSPAGLLQRAEVSIENPDTSATPMGSAYKKATILHIYCWGPGTRGALITRIGFGGPL